MIEINKEEKKILLQIVRDTISEYLLTGKIKIYEEASLPPSLLQRAGAFVTLQKKGKLRGCIGRLSSELPLYSIARKMGVNSATNDHRFSKLNYNELPEVDIEISILSPLERISSIDDFNPDIHGIYLTKDGRSGTFLPQVARQTGWTKEEVLGHCAKDKAGLDWDSWKDAELYVYTVQICAE